MRSLNESVQFIIEELGASGKLHLYHYTDFPIIIVNKKFKVAEKYGLKNSIYPAIKDIIDKTNPPSGTINITWNGQHLSTRNGTSAASSLNIILAFMNENRDDAKWMALCFAKVAKKGARMTAYGYLNPRNFSDDIEKKYIEYWTWIANHFGMEKTLPTAQTDPDLFKDILGEIIPEKSTIVKEVSYMEKMAKKYPYLKDAIIGLGNLKVDFKPETEAKIQVPEEQRGKVSEWFNTLESNGLLAYLDEGNGLFSYQITKIDLAESIAILASMPRLDPVGKTFTQITESGAVFHRQENADSKALKVEWAYGAIFESEHRTIKIGEIGNLESARIIANRFFEQMKILPIAEAIASMRIEKENFGGDLLEE